MLSYSLLFLIFAIPGKGEECPLGTYGEICDKNCSTHCAPFPSDGAVHCNKQTGMCSEGCNRGWHGDQCNFRCSENCLNHVCEVQRGTCVECKANYSGDYCEIYEGSCQKECEYQTAQENASTPVAAILVPVFVVVVILVIIIIILVVYTHRRRSARSTKERTMGWDDANSQKQELLPDGDVNHLQTQDTELHVACQQGNLQKVREILERSLGDINKRGRGGMTPVMWAARRGHRDILDLLVKKGAELDSLDYENNNLLHWACYGVHLAMVKHVVSKNMVDINCRGRDGRTPLMFAACQGKLNMFRLLVSKGGLPSQVDRDGNTILRLSCLGGDVKIVDYILSHKVDINGRGQSGMTPLMAAAYRGHGKILDLLVTKGADPKQTDDAGENVLHSACLGGHVDIVRRVLELDKVDINSRGQCSRTPLMMAARMGDKEIFDSLVKGGADATQVDDDSNTILHQASEGGNLDIVKYVLKVKDMDINARNKHNETATMCATNGSDVCNLLVSLDGLTE